MEKKEAGRDTSTVRGERINERALKQGATNGIVKVKSKEKPNYNKWTMM